MTRTVVRMLALHLGQGPQTDLLTRQFPVRFSVVSSQAPTAFQKARNEYEIEPQKGLGAHARIRTGDLFLTKEMLYRLSYMGVALRSSILSATNWATRCPRSTKLSPARGAGLPGSPPHRPTQSAPRVRCSSTPAPNPSAALRATFPVRS